MITFKAQSCERAIHECERLGFPLVDCYPTPLGQMPGVLTAVTAVCDNTKPASSAAFQPPAWWWVLSSTSMAASAWHGYRRNRSVGWAIGWGAMGALFPIITPAIGAAQGWGKRK